MDAYEIRTPTWSSGPISVASTRRERRLGLRRHGGADGLVLKARSVHTFGMTRPISVIECDRNGRILRAKRLKPRRVFYHPGAALIFETLASDLPQVGETVEVRLRASGHRATGDGRRETGDGGRAMGVGRP